MCFPRAVWRVFEWHHPGPLKKNQLPGVKWNLCFSRIPPRLWSLKRLGHNAYPALFTILSWCPKGNLIKRESQNINQPHLQILLRVCCLFDSDGGRMVENQALWEDDGPYSSAPPLRAAFQLVQQEIWGLCLLFLAFAEVVSVAEDTRAVARSPAGAKTVWFQVPRSHLLAEMGNILILANALMPALHVHPTLLPTSLTPSRAAEWPLDTHHLRVCPHSLAAPPSLEFLYLPGELTTVDTNTLTNC